MKFSRTSIPDVVVVTPGKHGDHRGFFSETFKLNMFKEFGIETEWIQDNHSYSSSIGVVRGLHFQAAPFAQDKLIRVTRGAILDVAVDIRRGSPWYGQHVAVELSADNWAQLLVPVGFAHGFCTLTADTEVLYKVSAGYSPASEGGLLWNDPALAIQWPIDAGQAVLSGRDHDWPTLDQLSSPFTY